MTAVRLVPSRKTQSHIMWIEPDDCRSVAYNPGLVSHNSGWPGTTISPNVVQNQPMKSGRAADDCGPLYIAGSMVTHAAAGKPIPVFARILAQLFPPRARNGNQWSASHGKTSGNAEDWPSVGASRVSRFSDAGSSSGWPVAVAW